MKRSAIRNIVEEIIKEEVQDKNRTLMTINPEWMKETYDKFNDLYWGGSLPTNLSFKLNGRLTSAYARAEYTTRKWEKDENGVFRSGIEKIVGIECSKGRRGETWVFENIMIHEMVHIADFYFHPEHYEVIFENGRQRSAFKRGGYDCHGADFFMKEAQRLSQYGWVVNKLLTPEEMSVVDYDNDYIAQTQKNKKLRQQREERKIKEAEERWKQLRYTIDKVEEKADIIQKLIERYTNNYTQSIGYRVLNIGDLKLIISDKKDWRAYVMDLDKKEDAPQIKYKATIYIGQNLLNDIKEKNLRSLDFSRMFEEDYHEMWDLEDEYEIY